MPSGLWWQDAVVYQIYPRSFQDSDGDGRGDLAGVVDRLDHLSWLGVSALWLSPIYPSPLADMGYDVADYSDVDPTYGTLADFDRLVAAAHAREIRVLMDLVPCHTSIEHPWFREHPDWYIWSDRDGPRNNWIATFGGSAWSRDPVSGNWYLHSFYPEQPDLDWRNPEVIAAMQGVLGFWLARGVDGFRIDAIDRLVKDARFRDDPPASAPFALPLGREYAQLEHLYSNNSPDIQFALAALRSAAGDKLLVGEVYLPSAALTPYLESLDLAFAFELFHSPWRPEALRDAIAGAAKLVHEGVSATAWVLSNHDFPRLASRFGQGNARAAAVVLLTLPGTAFVYQGEEIGMVDGAGADPPIDRAGRDGARHPMQWDGTPGAGFSEGVPWLSPVDPEIRNVEAQRGDPGSLLLLYRDLIALRHRLSGPVEGILAENGVLSYRRGRHLIVINLSGERVEHPVDGEIALSTHGGDGIEPSGAIVAAID